MVAVAIGIILALVAFVPASSQAAECPPDDPGCSSGGEEPTGPPTQLSDSTETANYATPTKSCSVYANGAGMGMYCVSVGDGTSKTLRERYGKQKLQTCRYSEIPPGIQKPFNSRPSEGHFMLMTCLGNIDFDTYNGGTDRTLDLSIVFVENGTDIADRHNDITDFLWKQFDSTTQMPVPFMQTKPNIVPLVGIPTYFTFKWIDPASKGTEVVAQGPYTGKANGGPYREIDRQGVTMRAEATKIVVDPRQQGVKATTCKPGTPYREGALPKDQPADACSITFPRSSASARKYATADIPSNVKDAFYATVQVTWKVTYGDGTTMNPLGNGFTMRMRQVLPVQEVQAPNQPPSVIY